jgi:hypothetical protein
MLPSAAAQELCRLGHDAISVLDTGMASAEDADVFVRAVEDDRIIVTENFADYADLLEARQARSERCVPIEFVRRVSLARRGALAVHVAKKLDHWAAASPAPFIGLHWP